jgi:hypothetical protein
MLVLGLCACRSDKESDGGNEGGTEDGGDGDGGECSGLPVPQDQLAQVYAEFLCGVFACQDYCPKLDDYGGVAACEAAITAEYQNLFAEYAQAGVGYDAGCAGALSALLQSVPQCSLPDGLDPGCSCDPFPGSAGLGDACMQQEFESMLWTGGTYIIDDCDADLYCDEECGVCIGFSLEEGQPCGGDCGGYCGLDFTCTDEVCTARASAGDACFSSFECKQGLYCEQELCAPTKGSGSDCLSGSECNEDMICEEGLCGPRKTAGQPCSSNSDCVDALQCGESNTCEALKGSGEACMNGSECEGGACTEDGRCTDYLCVL